MYVLGGGLTGALLYGILEPVLVPYTKPEVPIKRPLYVTILTSFTHIFCLCVCVYMQLNIIANVDSIIAGDLLCASSYMDRIVHTMAFVIQVVEHWLEQEIT